tara:strand:+ start:5464 stop:5694 length:231 start_codon:yes stop_codon:yes gene_type:complete
VGSFLFGEIMDLFKGSDSNKNFEITIIVRDKDGKPTGRKKTISSDNSSDVYNFVESNRPRKKRRRKKNQKKNEGNS